MQSVISKDVAKTVARTWSEAPQTWGQMKEFHNRWFPAPGKILSRAGA